MAMTTPRARRAVITEVLAMAEARKGLPQTCRAFEQQGAEAEPVFFGAHRKPAGVMLSYERYLELLDRLDDLAIALIVRERDQSDGGKRLTVDEVLDDLGFDRAKLEAEIRAEDEAENAPGKG
jgi:hypothetical protein